jgi:hypothetical protein
MRGLWLEPPASRPASRPRAWARASWRHRRPGAIHLCAKGLGRSFASVQRAADPRGRPRPTSGSRTWQRARPRAATSTPRTTTRWPARRHAPRRADPCRARRRHRGRTTADAPGRARGRSRRIQTRPRPRLLDLCRRSPWVAARSSSAGWGRDAAPKCWGRPTSRLSRTPPASAGCPTRVRPCRASDEDRRRDRRAAARLGRLRPHADRHESSGRERPSASPTRCADRSRVCGRSLRELPAPAGAGDHPLVSDASATAPTSPVPPAPRSTTRRSAPRRSGTCRSGWSCSDTLRGLSSCTTERS